MEPKEKQDQPKKRQLTKEQLELTKKHPSPDRQYLEMVMEQGATYESALEKLSELPEFF